MKQRKRPPTRSATWPRITTRSQQSAPRALDREGGIEERPGLSIKLSALHPRYEIAQRERVLAELLPRLLELAGAAARAGIPVTIDAEESDRLTLSLELFERVAREPALAGWDGLGLAVQAYQKRAPAGVRLACRLAAAIRAGASWCGS